MSNTQNQGDIMESQYNRTLNHFLEVWVIPNTKKRQEAGTLPRPLQLKAALVIFFPDNRENLVKINQEVCALQVKLKDGVSKKAGDSIYEYEIDWSSIPKLPKEYGDCGYIGFIKSPSSNSVHLFFNARYNRAISKHLIIMAKQFFETADYNYQKQSWPPFIDTLFSAAELAVKCILLTGLITDRKSLDNPKGHKKMENVFTAFADLGNIPANEKDAYLKLRKERNAARYMKGRNEYTPSMKQKQKY